MTKLSSKQTETARNNERLILRHLTGLSQKGLSDAMGWSESKVSRMKDGELEDLCAALAALDLKIVPLDACMVTPAERKFMAEQMILHYQKILDE
ncbi:CII family transcriptional regulator [Kingella kingae]|uniref:CII family transcriptional regulator n=1 Tax=Kingella kingae TaxID=504 RepID=UPI000376F2B4|nr:CII family transcriptional regulator [Kingella kingae]MDK4556204.1 CII family transcriptional regulator [Kingella kingae]MDK4577265.1 CII family transcriptional regulator [Kingella kingae]MDK4583284.1 CII family transcriptional regulator [Kingella kingae]MDK4585278.1 CII family transcriptional regulator [Kingella kingae]MDK4589244.1 CII family transcriptional regulator [Kingella kingae]